MIIVFLEYNIKTGATLDNVKKLKGRRNKPLKAQPVTFSSTTKMSLTLSSIEPTVVIPNIPFQQSETVDSTQTIFIPAFEETSTVSVKNKHVEKKEIPPFESPQDVSVHNSTLANKTQLGILEQGPTVTISSKNEFKQPETKPELEQRPNTTARSIIISSFRTTVSEQITPNQLEMHFLILGNSKRKQSYYICDGAVPT